MKFPNFQYVKPASLDAAIATLSRHAEMAVPIAGGQSLLAGLSMRISYPEWVVDIGGLDELKGIDLAPDGGEVKIGALTRHVEVLNSEIIKTHLPLLHDAIQYVGHVGIRNRGTFGGSLAYADPAAELPACTIAMGGTVVVVGPDGRRHVPAEDFFLGFLETALQPGELIAEIRFPVEPRPDFSLILELSRRAGDFAQAGLVITAFVNEANAIHKPRVVYFGCVDQAQIAKNMSRFLDGATLPVSTLAGLEEAVLADIQASDSPGCAAATKERWAVVLTRRVIEQLNKQGAK
ncbi:FAD binding domain-containing protein [Pusillimonas sp.]|uniref:FAD binding domain-containing protein n=1 Tax=Pusillimonas sp. TaxID=3040095 RepID=UPI0037C7A4D1